METRKGVRNRFSAPALVVEKRKEVKLVIVMSLPCLFDRVFMMMWIS
jgi:hypothetical protein